ncbi:MBL fold metallo-hydrolase [Sphingobacteriales bacterium UPWRP_1]|nr:MBL fold metallo-hydrolase [Sphingobacteriales bacterium TSM_CSM]PSJ79085.1 MBL fold metallo-hydrolase [Sphingobacteriales bacterium UPWRP_1]
MTIQFCGAAREVTGSSHLLTLDNGYKILLDCGLYQGNEEAFANFNRQWPFNPAEINCVILSHAHIDHSGRLPMLTRDGYEGEIICTHATRDLAAIMLMDSALIQERDVEFTNQQPGRSDLEVNEPLYVSEDVTKCFEQVVGIGYEHWHRINPDVEVLLRDNGHILGSASVMLRIKTGKNKTVMLGFTGDIGRPNRPILHDPIPMLPCDVLISESTYGDRLHESPPNEKEKLLQIITETCIKNKGKLIIPAFSVGKTQEIVYMLDALQQQGQLPKIPVYVDSPLATNATHVFQMHPECFDKQITEYMRVDPNPFGFNQLTYVRTVEASKRLNYDRKPSIIISASGMANAGRIKHHIYHNIENARNTILFVGYCAPYTLGGEIKSGAKSVRIFGEVRRVKAKIAEMDSFSAHGDQQEMIDFLNNQDRNRLNRLFLVHGEYEVQKKFKTALENHNFSNVSIPQLGETFDLNV